MGIEKAEFKALVISEVETEFEEVLVAEEARQHRQEGAAGAFAAASKACLDIQGHVERDIDEGKLDLEVAKHVKLYVSRCAQACEGLMRQAENNVYIASGRVAATARNVDLLKKRRDIEVAKAQRIQREAEEEAEKLAPKRKKAVSRKKRK